MKAGQGYVIDGYGRIAGKNIAVDARIIADGDPRDWLEPFGPSERDLLRVATAVHAVDRLESRRGGRGVEGRYIRWQRELHLRIAVEQPHVWNTARSLLLELLQFLTDDRWSIEFDQCESIPKQRPLFPASVGEIALFSGGLDSVAGAFSRGRDGRSIHAVSVYGTNVRAKFQEEAIAALRRLGSTVHRVRFVHHLNHAAARHETQRSRGFLFLAVGAACARAAGRDEVYTYENGIGALNPAMNEAQVGAQNTRSMHPGALVRMERLLCDVQERPVGLEAPFLFHTKGDLCRAAGSSLADLVAVAQSCDEGERNKQDAHAHCGLCTSCLLRGAGVLAAMNADPTPYHRTTNRHGGYDIRAFVNQAKRYGSTTTWNEMLALEPQLRWMERYAASRGIAAPEARARVIDLFRRHLAEVKELMRKVNPAPRPSEALVGVVQ